MAPVPGSVGIPFPVLAETSVRFGRFSSSKHDAKVFSPNTALDKSAREGLRKVVPAVSVAVVVVLVAASATYYYVSRNGPPSSDHSQCGDPDSISSHVYNAYRLNVIRSCITASGIVESVLQEADGDYHVRLALDSQYSNLTNSANDQYQYGDLVVEIICALPITQSDAASACQNYTNTITIPSVNDHITVTGPYVLDTYHSNWGEIHPVYTLTIS
jgi:hypothetical protein